MFEKLHKINNRNQSEINQILKSIITNFQNEKQYQNISNSQNKIEEIITFQIKNLISNSNICQIYSTSPNLESTAILIDISNNKNKKEFSKLISKITTIKQIPKLIKILKPIEVLKIISNTIITNNHLKFLIPKSDYILYSVNVQDKHKGKGQAKKLINEILNEFDLNKLTCSINTSNPNNIHIYEHFDFKISKLKTNEKIKQYQLIRNPQITRLKITKKY